MARIHVLDVPEFAGLVRSAREQQGVTITEARKGYLTIASDNDLVFHRRACGFKPALWYTCLSGGIDGKIATYDRDELRIAGGTQS